MGTKVTVLLVIASVAVSTSQAYYHGNDKAHYKFGYGVNDPHTHDHKHHLEVRHGDHVVGEYSLKEPDGSFRVVKYKAGPHTGFEAYMEEIGKPEEKKSESINDIGVFRWDDGDDGNGQAHENRRKHRE